MASSNRPSNVPAFLKALDIDRPRSTPPEPPEPDPIPPWTVCAPVSAGAEVKSTVPYHVLIEALSPRYETLAGGMVPVLGGNRLATDAGTFSLTVVADVEIRQTWQLLDMLRGDVAATLPMAPAEKLTFRMMRSQRSRLERKVMDSKEEIRNRESTTSDKEVMEATRNVSRNEGFNVNGSAGVSLGYFNANVSAGYQANIAEQSQSSLEQVREATDKASNQLKTLNKIEVTETSDVMSLNEQVRTLTNPYHDRAMLVVVYELLKRYRVTHTVEALRPALALSAQLVFDDRFVTRNVDFLQRTLLDRQLASDLPAVLSIQSERSEALDPERLNELIDLGFYFLFDCENVYFLNEDMERVGAVPEYDIKQSFDATQDPSAWGEARSRSGAAELFLVLTTFFRIWWNMTGRTEPVWLFQDPTFPRQGDHARLKIDLFRVLTKELKKRWALLQPGDITALFSGNARTEAFRRIPGFLTISENLVMPALGERPVDETTGQQIGPDVRPALVIARAVEHLRCFASFYTERFFEYIHDATAGHAHQTLFTETVTRYLAGLDAATQRRFLERFDARRGYLDGTRFIVPYRGDAPSEVIAAAFGLPTDPDGTGDLGFRFPTLETVVELPADGGQIEAVAGECVLANVPKPCCPPGTTRDDGGHGPPDDGGHGPPDDDADDSDEPSPPADEGKHAQHVHG